VNLIAPSTSFQPRQNQLDTRVTKLFRFNGLRLQANMDIFNITNGADAVSVNTTFGSPKWLVPTSTVTGRLFKFSAMLDF